MNFALQMNIPDLFLLILKCLSLSIVIFDSEKCISEPTEKISLQIQFNYSETNPLNSCRECLFAVRVCECLWLRTTCIEFGPVLPPLRPMSPESSTIRQCLDLRLHDGPSVAVDSSCVSSRTTAAECRTGRHDERCLRLVPACSSSSPL